MIKEKEPSFVERYQEGLQQHLRNRNRGGSTLSVARLLGHDAANRGINVLDIIEIHDQSMSALASPTSLAREVNTQNPLTPPITFLIEVLKPYDLSNLEDANPKSAPALSDDPHQGCKDQLAEVKHRYDELLTESKNVQLESQKLARQILMAHEEERKEISRELHDELAQILAGINIRLALIKETSVSNDRSITKNIQQTQKMVEESVDMVHRFACRLRPAILDDLGLIPAIRSYIKELSKRKGLDIKFSSTEEVEKLDSMHRTVLYRVVQEALLNVARHAEAKVVTVGIKKIYNWIHLEIHDDGKSFQVDPFLSINNHQRLGLLGMRERVEMVGGEFLIHSKTGEGTMVCAEIPFLTSEEIAV